MDNKNIEIKLEYFLVALVLDFSFTPPEVKQAGISLIVGIISAVAFVGALAFSLIQKPPTQDSFESESVDEFQVTQAKDGSFIPLIYGTNKVTGHIWFSGNVDTREVYQRVKGGKGGGGSKKQKVGTEFRIDFWQGICKGQVELLATYVNNERKGISASSVVFNNGTGSNLAPDFVGQPSKNKGVANIAIEKLFLGLNNTQPPTIHYEVKKILNYGFPNENTDDGNNPAAIVWDLFVKELGVNESDMDRSSFDSAAIYWSDRGYFLAPMYTQAITIDNVLSQLQKAVDFTLCTNKENKIEIRPFDPLATADYVMVDGDYKDITYNRQSYRQLPNDIYIKYKDREKDYTPRSIGLANTAVIEITGRRVKKTIDVSMIRSESMASDRLHEIVRNETYPRLQVKFKTNLNFYGVEVGDIIDLTHDYLGVTNLFLRVTKVNREKIDSNEIEIHALQVVERLFETSFQNLGGSTPSGTTEQLIEPDSEILEIFEFPWNPFSRFERFIFALVRRQSGEETDFDINYSPVSTPIPPAIDLEFNTATNMNSFSQSGSLDQEFILSDLVGENIEIFYTPDFAYYPEFEQEEFELTISNNTRYAIIDSEIITFATITPLGLGQFKLSGIHRGVFGSRIRNTYPIGTTILLFNILDNILNFVPQNGSKVQSKAFFLEKEEVAPLSEYNTENYRHTFMPRIPCLVFITKTGTSIDVELSYSNHGEGGFNEGTPETTDPFSIGLPEGYTVTIYFAKDTNNNLQTFTTNVFTASLPSTAQVEMNIEISETYEGELQESQVASFIVPLADGEYEYNFISTWSKKKYISSVWIKDYIAEFKKE